MIPDKLFLWNYFWYKTQDPGTRIACYSWHGSQLHSGLGLGLGVLENPGTYYCSRRWRPCGHSIACSVALLCSKAVDSWTLQRNTTALPWRVRRPPNLDKSWQAALFCPQWPPATAFNIRFPRIFSPNQIPWKLMTTWPLTSTHFCLVVHNQILNFRRNPRIFNERTLLVAYYRVSKCFSTKLTVLLQSVFWHAPFTQNWGSRQKKVRVCVILPQQATADEGVGGKRLRDILWS